MLPTDFPESNFTFTKPESMTDEGCLSLKVFKGVDNDGLPCIISKWQPSKEDIEAINRGEGIYLNIVSNIMPPVSIFTESPFITTDNA